MNSRQGLATFVCTFVLFSFSYLYPQTDNPYVEISLDSVNVIAGDTAVVTMTLHSQIRLGALDFHITRIPADNVKYIGRRNLWSSRFANATAEVDGMVKVLYFGSGTIDTSRIKLLQFKFLIDENAPSQTVGLIMSNAGAIDNDYKRYPVLLTDGAITIEGSASTPAQADPWVLSGNIYTGINSEIFVVSSSDNAFSATILEMHFDSTVLEYAESVRLLGRASDMTVTTGKIGDPVTGVRMVIYSLQDAEIEAGSGYIAKVSLKAKDGVTSGTTTQIYLTYQSSKDTLAVQEFKIVGSGSSPLIHDPGPQELTVGQDYLLQLDAVDPDGDALTYRVISFDYPGDYIFLGQTGQFAWTPTQAGNYVAEFAASDGENEYSVTVIFAVLEGNIPPEWQSEIVEIAAVEGQPVAYTFDSPTDFNQDALTITYSDIPENALFDPATLTFNWTPGLEDAGEYTFTLVVTDPDGERDYLYAVVTVENKNQPPALSLESDSYQINQDQALSFLVTASDPENKNTEILVSALPAGAVFIDGYFSWSSAVAGDYNLVFIARDPELAADTAQVNLTVIKINHPPVFAGIADTTINESEQLLLTIEASDPDGDNLTIFHDTADQTGNIFSRGATFGNGSFTWTPASTDIGVNLVEFFVQDQDGLSDTLEFKITVNVTGREIQVPVELSDIDPQILKEREYWEFEIPVATGGRDSLTFWVENLPPQAAFDPQAGVFKWTPGFFQSGIYSMIVGVHDGSFTDSRDLDVIVMEKDVIPVLFSDQDITIQETDNLSTEFVAVDSSGDRLSFSASGLPANAQLTSSGLLTYTPGYGEAGEYPVTLTVTDPAGNTDVSNWSLVVMHKNRPPVINAEDWEVNTGRYIWTWWDATDPDGDDVTLTVSGLPSGATFNEETGKFRWYVDTVGSYPITFYADDGNPGGLDSTLIYIIAGQGNRPPKFAPFVYSEYMLESRKYSYSIEASDPDEGDKIEIGYYGSFPDGFEVITTGENPVKGIWTWTPSYRLQGTYHFRFWAKDDGPYRLVDRRSMNLWFWDNVVSPFFSGELEGTSWLELSVDENGRLEVNLTAEALDDAPFNFYLVNNPPNISISERDHPIPDIMICTPDYSQAGTYEFLIELSNGYFKLLKRVRLTVNDVNRPPSVPPIEDQSVNEGQIITFQVDAIDPDGDAFDVFTAGRVPFLTAGSNPPARIRDGNVFIFDTDLLPADQQIESAVFLFWAEDVRGGISDTVQVEIAVVRQDSTPVDLGGTMLAAVDTIRWDGMGVSISLNNTGGSQLSGNISAYEKSGFINPSAGYELPLLASASKTKQKPAGLYSFLAGEFTSQFYSLRRGWGINMQAFANPSHPDSLASGLGASVTVNYLQDDLPGEIPNFTEDRMRIFGFDSTLNTWVLAEGQSVDTVANSATFMLTNPRITEYTLGASIDVIPPEIGSLQIKGGTFTLSAASIDTMYNLGGSYDFQVEIDDDEALSSSKTEALLYYAVGSESFSELAMTRTSQNNNTFSASLSLGAVESGTDISYYIVARDEMNEVLLPDGAPLAVYHLSLLEYTGKPGDLDQNITINIFDLLELLKVLGGTVDVSPASDVNLDGKTDIFDLLELLKLLATD